MPAEVKKVSLTSLLAPRKAETQKVYEQNKGKAFTPGGFLDLPAGIKNGIAQLVSAKAGQYATGDDKGQPYVMFRVIPMSPETHNGMPVKNVGAMKMYPLCDQPKHINKTHPQGYSYAENLGTFINELRGFGIMDAKPDNFDAILDYLSTKGKPLIYFSTTGYTPEATPERPNPKENITVWFNGLVPADKKPAPVPAGAGIEDSTGTTDEPEPLDEGSDANELDLIELGTRADDDSDMEALEQLKEVARANGITDDVMDGPKYKTWAALAQVLIDMRASPSEDSGLMDGEVPQVEDEPPTVKQMVKYQDPAKKKGSKPVDCEVLKVDAKSKTADLLNFIDKRTKYAAIPWSEILPG